MRTDKPFNRLGLGSRGQLATAVRWWAVAGAVTIMTLPWTALAQSWPARQTPSNLSLHSSRSTAEPNVQVTSSRSTSSSDAARSTLNWRAPYRHIQRGSDHRKTFASAPRQSGQQRVTVRHASTRPATRRTEHPTSNGLDLPLVQPANFESPSPLDDPFDDYLTSRAQARPDPFENQVAEENRSAPRLIRPKTSRPILTSANSKARLNSTNITGSPFREVQLAQSEAVDADSVFDFSLPPLEQDSTLEDSEPGNALSSPTDADPLLSPATRDATSDDMAPFQEVPESAGMGEDTTGDQTMTGPGFDPSPEPFADLDRQEIPCDRYHGPDLNDGSRSSKRNCCAEEEGCRIAVELLRSKPISTISLDIAPPFDPKPEATNYAPAIQVSRLAKSAPRVWRDRQGRVLAEGRLVNFRSSQVIVLDQYGRDIPIPYFRLGDDELCFLNAWWGTPPECRLGDDVVASRNWQSTTFTWKASALCHKPLYFEEEQLERYGHSAGPIRQPVLSATHFVFNLAFAPYHMGVHPPNECLYALGYYRPGNCAPWLVHAIPISLRGALSQVAAVAVLAPLPY